MKTKLFNYKFFIHIVFILLCASFVIPLVYMISLSFTPEDVIRSNGYQLIPQTIDTSAYELIFKDPRQLIDSYKLTAAYSVVSTFLGLVVMTMVAYAISRQQFSGRNAVTFFIYFTMLFSGGLVPTYMLNTKYLHLTNSFWVYVLPGLAAGYYILILRTFFRNIPSSLVEAAKIDGASEFKIFYKIVIPLSKPVLATVALLTLLGKWNDWQTSLLYATEPNMYSLQYLLQKILREADFLEKMASEGNLNSAINVQKSAPLESMRFAMAVLVAGPMLVIFPFFQKYFTRGLTVGAVKG